MLENARPKRSLLWMSDSLGRTPKKGSMINEMVDNWNNGENKVRQTENEQEGSHGSRDNYQQASE